jgi:trans-2,3-dihydro-3-hydroxyanthranilate isomerase
MKLRTLPFALVDVFAREPLNGNSLSIFLLDSAISTGAMQRITQELRQFETIFLERIGTGNRFTTRIFTMEEELAFAGHPIIGASAFLHEKLFPQLGEVQLEFATSERVISTISRVTDSVYIAEMDQGAASINVPIARERYEALLDALNLSVADLVPGLPLQVISTGLPYLIVPLQSNLERARIVHPQFETLLASVGAKFVYVLDVKNREGRTWDNDGRVEDIATGSAAGPAAVYLVARGVENAGAGFVLHQGRFVGRPSELQVEVRGKTEWSATVRGQVCFVGNGSFNLPRALLLA